MVLTLLLIGIAVPPTSSRAEDVSTPRFVSTTFGKICNPVSSAHNLSNCRIPTMWSTNGTTMSSMNTATVSTRCPTCVAMPIHLGKC